MPRDFKIWKDITMLGISAEMSYPIQKRIWLTNRISAVTTIVLLFASIGYFSQGYPLTGSISVLVLLQTSSSLLLTKQQKFNLAKFNYCLVTPFLFLLSSIFIKTYEPVSLNTFNYFYPRFALMCWVIFPFILFDIKRKYHIIGSVAFISILLYSFDPIHQYLGLVPHSINLDTLDHQLINTTQHITLFLLAISFIILQKTNAAYEGKIENLLEDVHRTNEELEESATFLEEAMEELMTSNNEIHLQKKQIENQNDYLTEINKELVEVKKEIETKNNQLQIYNEKLEQEVEERTLRWMITNNQLLTANKELDTFIYRASHDLMGPITTLKGLSNLALIDKANTSQYLERFHVNINTMHYRLSQLLQMLSIKDVEICLAPASLNQIIKQAISQLNPAISHPFIEIVEDIPTNIFLNTDKELLQIAFEHVLRNSLQYSKKNQNHSYIKIEVTVDEFTACIKISDNGIGIAPEVGPKIFDMFYRGTEQSKGAGLGLYVAKKAIEKINGDIAWESSDDQTTFSILLARKIDIIPTKRNETGSLATENLLNLKV